MLTYNPVDANKPEFEDGVVVVQFKHGVTQDSARALTDSLGLTLTSGPGGNGLAMVSVPVGTEDHFVAELKKSDLVDLTERSILAYIQKGGLL